MGNSEDWSELSVLMKRMCKVVKKLNKKWYDIKKNTKLALNYETLKSDQSTKIFLIWPVPDTINIWYQILSAFNIIYRLPSFNYYVRRKLLDFVPLPRMFPHVYWLETLHANAFNFLKYLYAFHPLNPLHYLKKKLLC